MSEKKITIFTIVYIVVVLLGGGVGVYFLQFRTLADAEKALASDKVLEAAMAAKQRDLDKKKVELALLPEKEKAVAKVIPTLPGGRWDDHTDHLHARALASQVSIVSIKEGRVTGRGKAGAPAAGAKADETYFDLSVKGGFNELCKFIHMLEMDTPLIVVENFAIKGGKTGAAGELPPKELKILLKAYGFQKIAEEPKKADGKAPAPTKGKPK